MLYGATVDIPMLLFKPCEAIPLLLIKRRTGNSCGSDEKYMDEKYVVWVGSLIHHIRSIWGLQVSFIHQIYVIGLHVPLSHPSVVCLLAVQQAFQQLQAAIREHNTQIRYQIDQRQKPWTIFTRTNIECTFSHGIYNLNWKKSLRSNPLICPSLSYNWQLVIYSCTMDPV
jgi:hypothetical protein